MSRPKLADVETNGVLAGRRLPDGRRRITLRRAEREALQRQERAEAAAALFLDLKENHTWKQIAEELDLSASQLRDLTKTREFDEAYERLFAELGHDPRYRAAQAKISDMLPLAIEKLADLLVSPNTSPGTRLKAIEKVIQLNGLEGQKQDKSDRQEIINFLQQNNINLGEMGIAVPTEYEDALEAVAVPVGEVSETGN
jgi:hypothetical protein